MPNENPEFHAFTFKYDILSRRLISDGVIIYYENKGLDVRALWDTGATNTCISEETAKKLAMIPTGKINIKTPSGTKEKYTYMVNIALPNHVGVKELVVCESEIGNQGIDLLIGMDVILLGDFAISNYQGKTTFTFRVPSKQTTDYVKQIQIENTIGKKRK